MACPAGKKVVGGGVDNDNFQLLLIQSRPYANGWQGWIKNPSATAQDSNMIEYAICAVSP